MQGDLHLPDFIHNPASLFPNLVEEAMAKKCANKSQLMQILREEHMSRQSSQPEIDKCLWTVDEYVEHVTHCDMNPCGFIKDYFGEGGLCNKRVLEIREFLTKSNQPQLTSQRLQNMFPNPILLLNLLTRQQLQILVVPHPREYIT